MEESSAEADGKSRRRRGGRFVLVGAVAGVGVRGVVGPSRMGRDGGGVVVGVG